MSSALEDFASKFNLTGQQYTLIMQSCDYTKAVSILELMKAKNPKSKTRIFLQGKIRRWLDRGLKSTPLSAQEFENIVPKYPIKYRLF